MGKWILARPWVIWSAVVLAIGVYGLSQIVDVEIVRERTDPRPVGSLADIRRLGERSDLNVLFILVDTLRADRLGSYGYPRDTSPTLDSLAATGVRFARQLSQSSWTKCSMASLWTGLYPVRTGVLRYQHAVAPEAQMPAEIFRQAGFRTAAIWRNSWVAPNFGFAQGFEVYHSPRPGPVAASVRRENPTIKLAGTDQDIIWSATEFMRTHTHERWFLYLHLMDVHQYVYDEASALFGESYSDIYDNSIRWVDRLLADLLAYVDGRGLRQRTLVILAADHGEAFGEHGLEGHARNVYGEVTEVPLILSLPFRLEPGLVVEARSQNVDLWPTVLALLELPPLEGADGRSLVPEIEAAASGDAAPEASGTAFAELDQTWGRTEAEPQPLVAVTEVDWRLIYPSVNADRAELYDRGTDPREQRNLAEERPEVVAELRRKAETYLASPPASWGTAPSVEIDDMELRQLRALGYSVGGGGG